ncbi:hypothetical protein [Roseovarius sp.]|jgi:hypothetical protein
MRSTVLAPRIRFVLQTQNGRVFLVWPFIGVLDLIDLIHGFGIV